MRRLAVITGLAFLATPGFAQETDGFRSPTGNIVCSYYGDDLGQSLRCDIGQTTNAVPPRPADCELDWGNAFEITVRSSIGERICYGDPNDGSAHPVLDYGQSFSRGDFTCASERTGVTCRNGNGAGFFLSRAAQRLF